MGEIRILEYLDRDARSPFALWLEGLSAPAAAKVTAAIYISDGGGKLVERQRCGTWGFGEKN